MMKAPKTRGHSMRTEKSEWWPPRAVLRYLPRRKCQGINLGNDGVDITQRIL